MVLITALESLYPSTPHLLCRWHINRAMEKQALSMEKLMWYKYIIMHSKESGWYRVINASTIDEFRSAWESFSEKWEELVIYVINTWGKYRKKFASCYTNQYLHLGNTATSRVESSHSLLKAWLKSVNLNIDTMWPRIHSMLEAQHLKIRYELEVSRSRPRNGDRVFSLLQGNVSINAIEIMEEEIKRGIKLGNVLEVHCGCVLRDTHGLPCACTLIHLQRTGKRVHLKDVHAYWRTLEYKNVQTIPKTDNDELEELIAEARASDPAKKRVIIEKMRDGLHPEDEEILPPPVRENPKGRPRGSTTRNKSGFEHAKRKAAKVSTPATTFVQHTVGDFDQGPVGAPLEFGYTKGLLSTWTKKYAVPEDVWDFFDGWVDVGNDGHCGYRVVSHAARGRKSDHLVMRDWGIEEIKEYEVYKEFFDDSCALPTGLTRYQETLRRIEFTGSGGCGSHHWMYGEYLFVFASLFNWTICVIAQDEVGESRSCQCSTYLPLRPTAQVSRPYSVLWIVNYHLHWMRLHCRVPSRDAPMPPIDPFWQGSKDPSVAPYADLYKTNIEKWHTLMGTTPKVYGRRRCSTPTDPETARKLNFDNVFKV
ncbi:uncharacterized protein LOC141651443 [Silene latifolia]|uniref:uncharacterized protein LOC141651443 n=1 Tax=Silene latifolia TaxID=37657 RepID=UPI003D785344